MRTKVTLVLLFLNVALFYAIFQFVIIVPPTDRSAVVLPPGVAAADRLEIRQTGREPLVLEKRGDTWFLGAPYDWPADRNAVDRLLNELALLRHEASFEVANLADTGQKLSDYGLEPAACALEIGIGPRRLELKIGAATQVQNRLYVLDPEGARIHVVNRSLVDALQLGPDRLRNTDLVDIPVFEARSLAVQLPAPSNLRVRLARSAQRWLLESPIQTRADKNAVELALSRLHELKVARFLDGAAKNAATALDTPALRVTVEGNQRRVILLLGAPLTTEPRPAGAPAETELFARLEDRAAVFTVILPDALLDSLRNAQTELRDRRLLEFERASVTAVSLQSPGQAEVTLQRLETGAWQVLAGQGSEIALPQPADPGQVGRLLEHLAQLRAVTFLSDAPFPADLEQWGFNRPTREVSLTLAPDTAAPATTLTLQLGVTRGDDGQALTHARLTDAQFVYLVRGGIVDDLPVVARHYRLRTLRDLPPGARITGISLRRLADSSVVFARELANGQDWDSALAAETPEIQAAVHQLLAELRTLRARDFIRDVFTTTLEVDGQPRPWVYQLDATIALSGAGEGSGQQVTSTLLLGEREGGSSQLAGSAEFNTVFHATQPLLDALFALTFGPRDPGVPPAASEGAPPPPPPPATAP